MVGARLIHPQLMCPRTFFLVQCIHWMMCPLDDVSPYDPSLSGEGGLLCIRIAWIGRVGTIEQCILDPAYIRSRV
jgi:hypothetical protein